MRLPGGGTCRVSNPPRMSPDLTYFSPACFLRSLSACVYNALVLFGEQGIWDSKLFENT